MKHLQKIANKYKPLIVIYLIMGLTQTFLQSFGASYFQKVIDNFTNGTLTLTNIVLYGTAMISLYIVCYLDEYPGRKLEHSIGLSLKIDALRKASVIDYLSYVKLGTGTLIQRIENGASAGSNILFGFYLKLAGELIPAIFFSIAFIFAINRTIVVTILLGYVVVFVITNLLLKSLYKVKESILVNEEKFNHFLVRGFMEMVVFRVNRRFTHEIQKAETASGEIVSSKVKMTLIHEAFFTVFAVLIAFVKIGIILYGWRTKTLTIGEVVALITLVDNAYTPIAIFNVLYVQYKLDKVSFARYAEFLDSKEDTHLTQGSPVSGINGGISFTNVGFRYNERRILNNFSLTIEQGKTIAFVGESGSGKSTTVKLLVGLLHPDTGCIQVDGFDLSQVNLNSYYQNIAYLPQEPPIFDGTLRENLVFDDQIDDMALVEAIRQVGLENLYTKMEKGLDTPLGERGVSLSGGERQKLALARLWFSDASIIIFDEATSAIDNLSEEAVMKNVMNHLAEKTVIAIAHRLDSIKSFEDIVVFQDGCIVEQGRFDDLLEKRKCFYELYNRSLAE